MATIFAEPYRLMQGKQLVETTENGTTITPVASLTPVDFSEGVAKIVLHRGKEGYVDKSGQLLFTCDHGGNFHDGLAFVRSAGQEGYVDKTFRMVITSQWDEAEPFSEGLAKICFGERYGFIDTTGRVAVPCQWEAAYDFSEGMAWVMDVNEQWGCIDMRGRLVIPCRYDEPNNFSEGLACAYDFPSHEMFYLDKTGRKVFNVEAGDELGDFSEGIAAVSGYGFIDRQGNLLFEDPDVQYATFSEGVAAVCRNGHWGFIDHSNRTIIPFEWDEAHDFAEGLAAVKDAGGRYGFIDHSGRTVIPCFWNHARSFSEGLACVSLGNRSYFINKQGNVLCTIKEQ